MESNSAQGTLNNASQQQQAQQTQQQGAQQVASNDFGFMDSSAMGAGNALPMDGIGQGADQRTQQQSQQQQQSQPQFDIEKMISEVIGGQPQQAQQLDQQSQDAQQTDDKLSRFDQHPRWIQREQEMQQLKSDLDILKGQLMARQQQPPQDMGQVQQPQVPYKDVTTMSNEDIQQWFDGDKVGFMANFYAQVAHETKQNIMQELGAQRQQQSVAQTYEQFADKHPDIKQMWAGGQIQQFMNQHPGHTPISAYYELKGGLSSDQQLSQQQLDEAVAKAKKDAEQEIATKLRAKFQALGVLGAAPAGANTGNQTFTDLRTSPKGNSLTSTLAAKLDALRASGGN